MRKLLVQSRLSKVVSTAVLALVLSGPLTPVMAQDAQTEARIRKLEAEIRALQRKVFPGGDNRYFEAEIKQNPTTATPGTSPATSAVTDMLARMDALETQVTRLTGQIEENSNRIAQLEGRAGVGTSPAVPMPNPPPSPPPGFSPNPSAMTSTPAPTPNPAPQANLGAMSGGSSAASSAASNPSPNRMEAVRAIAKPQTDDAGDDEYSYGFRLWDAKFYPEAEQQLKMFVEKYPKHWRTSWGRNLLGRAYLDDGNPREAAKWFLQNYQSDKSGDRAPDSLLYLAVAMKQLKDTKRACISLAEFSETYAAEAAGRLHSLYESTRNGLDCDR